MEDIVYILTSPKKSRGREVIAILRRQMSRNVENIQKKRLRNEKCAELSIHLAITSSPPFFSFFKNLGLINIFISMVIKKWHKIVYIERHLDVFVKYVNTSTSFISLSQSKPL